MVIKLEIDAYNHLVGTSETTGVKIDYGQMVNLPKKRNPMEGRMRWKDASLLTTEQATDETYQKKNKIA